MNRLDTRRAGRDRLSPVCVTLVALAVTLCAPLVGPGAQAAPIDRPTFDLPFMPGTSIAQRLAAHRAEAQMPGYQVQAQSIMPLAYTAADFANLPQGAWQLVHQEVTVETEPSVPLLRVKGAVKVRPKDGETVEKLTFRTDVIDDKSLVVTDAAGNPLKAKYVLIAKIMGRIEVSLPAPLTEAVDTSIQFAYEAVLDCNSKTTMLKSCSFDKEFQSVMFFDYFLQHGEVGHAPFSSTLHVLTEQGVVAAAPGIPLPAQPTDDGRLSWTFLQPERTSNAGFTIANYQPVGDEVPEPASKANPFVRVYTIGSFIKNAALVVKTAKKMLDFFGQRFVAFPWAGVNIIQNAQSLGGGYAPLSGVFMLRQVFGMVENGWYWTMANELMAHELAHQWWGNLARPLKSGDVSLSESLAEFSSCLYTEKVLGNRSQIIGDNLSYMYTVPWNADVPLGSNYVTGSGQAYVPIVYHKGAVVMDMLRIELGEATMLQGLAHYAEAFDRDYAEVSDLQASMEAVSGRNLSWYFKQWFMGKGAIHVQFAGRVQPAEGGKWRFRLRATTLGYVTMRFKLPIRVTHVDGSTTDSFVDIIPDGDGPAVGEVLLDKRPRGIRADPDRRLLRTFDVLTPGDVNLDGLTDGADFLEAAYRKGRSILATNHNGQTVLFPNAGWDELYNVAKDKAQIVNEADLDLISENLGAEVIDF